MVLVQRLCTRSECWWGRKKNGKNTMILSRLLAPSAAQLARCTHRRIHTSASRFGGHPRGIPESERLYKILRGRSPPNDIVLFFGTIGMLLAYTRISYFMIAHFDHWTGGHFKIPKWYDFTDEELGIPPDELGLLKPENV